MSTTRLVNTRWLVIAALGFSCTSPTGSVDVNVEAFDRQCEFDDDCVVVPSQKCTTCSCSVGAIATSAEEAFDADYDAIDCVDPNEGAICGPCAQMLPACVEGICEARQAVYPDSLERQCAVATDCSAVPAGEVCACSCEFVPATQASATAFSESTADVQCAPRDQCRCEFPSVGCTNDECVLTN